MEKYIELTAEWNRSVSTNMVTIECTKHICGYAFFIQVYKTSTVEDIHNMICDHIGAPRNSVSIYLRTQNMPDIILSKTDATSILELIRLFKSYMIPIYPMPANVVYRMYIDDGHCCSNECSVCINKG